MSSVAVNPPKTPVTKGSNGIAAATTPNVCKMPGPPAPFVPTPLPNIGKSGSSPDKYTKDVKVEGNTVAIKGASFGSEGDMASKGTGGGLVSANTHGPTKFIGPGSLDVKFEGKNVQLLADPMLNNCGPSGSPPNAATMGGEMQSPLVVLSKPTKEQQSGKKEKCTIYTFSGSKLIAKAIDRNIVPRVERVEWGRLLKLGQDALHMSNRPDIQGFFPFPYEKSLFETDRAGYESLLKARMGTLLDFASADSTSGAAKRLFDKFRAKASSNVEVFSDTGLNHAVEASENFRAFADRTVAAPGTPGTDPKKTRIHQALQKVGWDINQVKVMDDLGVPAFNDGTQWMQTGDWDNGLGVMINSVQYVFVYVQDYKYDSCKGKYTIKLKFVLYDVFGLDDDDLVEYGHKPIYGPGFTAWWRLQFQFNYAPLLTKAWVEKTYTVPV